MKLAQNPSFAQTGQVADLVAERLKIARVRRSSTSEATSGRRRAIRQKSRTQQLVDDAKSAGCVCCPEISFACLDFHHLDPATKLFCVGVRGGHSFDAVRAEIAKCVVLCANCHRKAHAGEIDLLEAI